jgi:hypothetical protein
VGNDFATRQTKTGKSAINEHAITKVVFEVFGHCGGDINKSKLFSTSKEFFESRVIYNGIVFSNVKSAFYEKQNHWLSDKEMELRIFFTFCHT